jgi:hypothetical protein
MRGGTYRASQTVVIPGIAVRRTASLPFAYDRVIQYSRDGSDKLRGRGVLGHPVKAG